MRILAFDSSGNGCSAAVMAEDRILAHRFEAMERGQAERLVPMIEHVMTEAGIGFAALDLIAVTVGPGAFTGVRIGLATARGLGLATGLPVVGLTSFAAVAAPAEGGLRPEERLVAALDSRREELYLQAFDPGMHPLGEGTLVAPDAWASWVPAGALVLAGDGAGRLQSALEDRAIRCLPGPGVPDAAAVARLAARQWRPGDKPAPLEPLYLRAPDTTLPASARKTLALS